MPTFLIVLLLLLSQNSFSALAGEVYAYRNKANLDDLTLEEARKIIKARKLSWSNGENIVVILNELTQIKESDFVEFSEMSKTQFLNDWRIKFFSGRALIPIQVNKTLNALETLKNNPSGIFFSFQPLDEGDLAPEKSIKVDKISF